MLNRRQLVAVAIVALTLVVWAYIVPALLNYLHYYSALDQLGVDVTEMSVIKNDTNVTVDLHFLISNPTSYVGLYLISLAYQARPNGTISGLAGTGFATLATQIGSHSTVQVAPSFILTGPGMTELESLCSQYGGRLSWDISVQLGLKTRDGSLAQSFEVPSSTQC